MLSMTELWEENGWSDLTDMKPELHERKWEIDSLCYPLRLAYQYWKETGDASIFDSEWIQAITNILSTFKEQQRKEGVGPYKFQRKTETCTRYIKQQRFRCSCESCRTNCFSLPSI